MPVTAKARKQFILPIAKIRKAKKILSAKTDTEAVERALDLQCGHFAGSQRHADTRLRCVSAPARKEPHCFGRARDFRRSSSHAQARRHCGARAVIAPHDLPMARRA